MHTRGVSVRTELLGSAVDLFHYTLWLVAKTESERQALADFPGVLEIDSENVLARVREIPGRLAERADAPYDDVGRRLRGIYDRAGWMGGIRGDGQTAIFQVRVANVGLVALVIAAEGEG